jgi:hypothetical protein
LPIFSETSVSKASAKLQSFSVPTKHFDKNFMLKNIFSTNSSLSNRRASPYGLAERPQPSPRRGEIRFLGGCFKERLQKGDFGRDFKGGHNRRPTDASIRRTPPSGECSGRRRALGARFALHSSLGATPKSSPCGRQTGSTLCRLTILRAAIEAGKPTGDKPYSKKIDQS